jgi:hypothetical protein
MDGNEYLSWFLFANEMPVLLLYNFQCRLKEEV